MKNKIMVSINEASKYTGLSYHTIRKLCLENRIVYMRSGVKYYINLPKLIEYINNGDSK